jgi:hypothetical protein
MFDREQGFVKFKKKLWTEKIALGCDSPYIQDIDKDSSMLDICNKKQLSIFSQLPDLHNYALVFNTTQCRNLSLS